MNKSPLLAAALVAACASLPGSSGDAASLAAAESAFAAQSVREDMRAAFLAHFAPGGMVVRGQWVEIHAWLGPRAAPPIVLEWRPVHVETARSGDMGLSTGPWRSTPRGATSPTAYGQFASIWTRAPGEPWRVAVDHGISHAEPVLWEAPLDARAAPAAAAGPGTLEEAEAAFGRESAAHGAAAAYRAYAAADLRLYREGHAPWLGRDAALAGGAIPAEAMGWTVERSGTAASADFGYARGHLGTGEAPRGFYVRAWRREAAGWRIVLDVLTPAPKG
jgi:ketosteroid isomerase-like protein